MMIARIRLANNWRQVIQVTAVELDPETQNIFVTLVNGKRVALINDSVVSVMDGGKEVEYFEGKAFVPPAEGAE
jgi:hypothetical protein